MSTTGVDSPPSANVPQRGGFLGFLGTIPGILTAFAGVITALASLSYIAYLSSQQPSVPDQPPVSEQQVPDAPVDAGTVATRAEAVPVAYDPMLSDQANALLTDCANGYLDQCDDLLYLLADDCTYGDAYSCDTLYLISPVGSDYEAYGATCGGLVEWQYGRCTEL
jgi:hypothetical protein